MTQEGEIKVYTQRCSYKGCKNSSWSLKPPKRQWCYQCENFPSMRPDYKGPEQPKTGLSGTLVFYTGIWIPNVTINTGTMASITHYG